MIARRHAEYYRGVFEQAEVEWKTRPAVEWVADYGPLIDNLRYALDWAFSSEGDASIGLALTAVGVRCGCAYHSWVSATRVPSGLSSHHRCRRESGHAPRDEGAGRTGYVALLHQRSRCYRS